uniref:Uncharacterized protein n=1 Tax=Arundo donax TaxID=35708 RepID=A0A0A9BG90_ARUDO
MFRTITLSTFPLSGHIR